MKKYYVLLAIFGVMAGYAADSALLFEDERDIYFPITKEQLKVKKSNVAGLVDLSKISQSELLFEVYNKKVLLDSKNQAGYFEMIKKRMATEYPVSAKASHREVNARLGLLQAMVVFWNSNGAAVEHSQLSQFFAQVAKSKQENLMVRRQAYKNWLTFQAQPNSRLASLANHSDENLIGSLAQDAH